MKKILYSMLTAMMLITVPASSFAAVKHTSVPVKTVVKKTTTKKTSKKVVSKKKVVAKAKKKWNGTSRLLSAPLIDPSNPPGGPQ